VAVHLELMSTMNAEEFIAHYAKLRGQDPDTLYAGFVRDVVNHVKEYQSLSENERKLKSELKKFEIEQKLSKKYSELEEQRRKQEDEAQTKEQRKAEVFKSLEAHEISRDEFLDGFEQVIKLMEEGKLPQENYDEYDIIYFIRKQKVLTLIDESVKGAVKNPTPEYKRRLELALEAEEKYRGKPLTKAEIQTVLKKLIGGDKKTVQENLTKKAAAVGVAKSEKVRSRTEDKRESLSPLDILNGLNKF